MPASKLPFLRPASVEAAAATSTSASVTGRRYARRASVERIFFAQADSSPRRVAGLADENPAAARRVAGARRVERPGDLDVLDQRHSVHVLQIEIARERLQRLVRFGGVLLEERRRRRRADRPSPGCASSAARRSSLLAGARFVSDILLSSSPPTGARNTRSPSIVISS